MTPLARKIVNELMLPLKQREFNDVCGILKRMSDVHCFEVSEVSLLSRSMMEDMIRLPKSVGPLAFLPAQRTWIEEKDTDGARFGVLLSSVNGPDGKPHHAAVDTAVWSDRSFKSVGNGVIELIGSLRPGEAPRSMMLSHCKTTPDDLESNRFTYWLYAVLALINSPRIIGRKQHMPHRGLERAIIARRGVIGKFPLHAWTEIKLEVNSPKDASGEGSQEAHYTGERALHFCRAHIRIRLGKLEIVRGHWRGDASLGMRQSRYKLISRAATGEKLAPANEDAA
jgi:hypothetical protein